MTTMFCYPEMFRNSIENTGLKLPKNMNNFDSNEYPHLEVFLTLHLARPIDLNNSINNAEIIAKVPDDKIKTITITQLQALGVNLNTYGNMV